MDIALLRSVRAVYFVLFLLGCAWIGMGLYTILSFTQLVQSTDVSYLSLSSFLVLLLAYMQIVLGAGLVRRQKWVMSIIGIHIFVTLFTLLVVLPQVGLHPLILPSAYSLALTYVPLFIICYVWRSYLTGAVNRLWVTIPYFLAIASVAAINTVLQVLHI